MEYSFNNEYLAKTFVDLIKDEGERIASLKLADRDQIKMLINAALKDKHTNIDVLLGALTDLHNKLSAVKLPGDFKKIGCGFGELLEQLDVPEDGSVKVEIFKVPDDQKIELVEPEECAECKKEDEDDLIDTGEKQNIEVSLAHTVNELTKLAYDLGSAGKHAAAYEIEKILRVIKLS